MIEVLLERWDDLAVPGNGPGGVRGDGQSVGLMPHERGCLVLRSSPPVCTCSRRAVEMLERLIPRLREVDRELWWHLNERFFRCSRVRRLVWVQRRGRNGKVLRVQEHQIVTIWRSDVDAELLGAALDWLAESWLGPEPMLPQDLRLTPPPRVVQSRASTWTGAPTVGEAA